MEIIKGVKDISVGFAMTGSFCTIARVMPRIEELVSLQVSVTPIMSEMLATTDTRFGKADDIKKRLEKITGKNAICTIPDAEPIGPQKMFDALIIAPCTGNTLAKISNGITDTSVTMAAKAHLRNGRPLILAFSTNDALGFNAKNIGALVGAKNIFLVPFSQDNPIEKASSAIADMDMILPTLFKALYEGKQIQPMLL